MKTKFDGRKFAKACQLGTDIWFRLVGDGVKADDDQELKSAFERVIGQYGVEEGYAGIVWASLLDQRELELGWD